MSFCNGNTNAIPSNVKTVVRERVLDKYYSYHNLNTLTLCPLGHPKKPKKKKPQKTTIFALFSFKTNNFFTHNPIKWWRLLFSSIFFSFLFINWNLITIFSFSSCLRWKQIQWLNCVCAMCTDVWKHFGGVAQDRLIYVGIADGSRRHSDGKKFQINDIHGCILYATVYIDFAGFFFFLVSCCCY